MERYLQGTDHRSCVNILKNKHYVVIILVFASLFAAVNETYVTHLVPRVDKMDNQSIH